MFSYNEFLLEKEFKYWNFLSESSNEDFDKLKNAINKFLDKEYTINPDKFEEIILNLFKRFRNKIGIITTIVSLLLTSYMNYDHVQILLNKSELPKKEQRIILSKINKPIHKKKNDISKFLHALAFKESSLDPTNINSLGYIGKYQFGEMALKDVGLDDKINTKKFRKNPDIWPEKEQDKAMIKLLKINKKYLGDYINDYEGKIVSGIKITKSGLLAGSHLLGAESIKKFLDTNGKYIPKDGNNVPITEYIKNFGGYNITL